MITLFESNDDLKQYVCNVIGEVEGEVNLIDKLRVELARVQEYLQNSVIEYDRELSETEIILMRMIVSYQAMANCIPALDVVLTPNGYGIVSTSNIAPASKERVERLIKAYEHGALEALYNLVAILRHSRDWWEVHQQRHPVFLGTCVDASIFGKYASIEDMRNAMRRIELPARQFESFLSDKVVGAEAMRLLRHAAIDSYCNEDSVSIYEDLTKTITDQVYKYISRYLNNETAQPCTRDLNVIAIANAMREHSEIWSAYQSFVDSFASSIIKPKKGALYF